jgi:hypothetical protein
MRNHHQQQKNQPTHPAKQDAEEKTATSTRVYAFNSVYAIRLLVPLKLADCVKFQTA